MIGLNVWRGRNDLEVFHLSFTGMDIIRISPSGLIEYREREKEEREKKGISPILSYQSSAD